jgi:ArsR family transcriptional regulator, lead/cadmium/zinc/bismuth-responsive transcriptional repressor
MSVMTKERTDLCEVRCVHPESVQRALDAQPSGENLTNATSLLKAIADPTRFRLLHALSSGELCVCDLAAVLGMNESAISHQLRVLREQHLVTPRKDGRIVYYRLADKHVTELLSNAMEHAVETW